MTPIYLNSLPSLLPHDLKEDQHHQVLLSTPNPNLSSSSSSSLSSNIFFNSSNRDHKDQQEGDNFATNGGPYEIENESDHSGLKFSIWKEEIRNENQSETTTFTTNIHHVKWMSSKMRLMHKMKKSDRTVVNAPTTTTLKVEDDHQKQPSSPPMENDNSSTNSSSNNSNGNPIRVCSDCNTTKTPLWRSGPRGPKSLCNACGIRQRKARRAMAAATAATNGTNFPTETSTVKITKAHHKEKRSNGGQKRCKIVVAPSPPSQGKEKLCFEDFLVSLSKNLAFHRVFPQDEKEAAILLMALSCGHVHG